MGAYENALADRHLKRPPREAARQRKWRVLLSIGLLLPALAAIIGIVAWAISIEVSQVNSLSSSSRKLASGRQASRAAEVQYLRRQSRQEEELQLEELRLKLMQQQQQQQQQTQTNAKTKSESDARLQQQGAEQQAASAPGGPQEAHHRKSLLLTNLDQVEIAMSSKPKTELANSPTFDQDEPRMRRHQRHQQRPADLDEQEVESAAEESKEQRPQDNRKTLLTANRRPLSSNKSRWLANDKGRLWRTSEPSSNDNAEMFTQSKNKEVASPTDVDHEAKENHNNDRYIILDKSSGQREQDDTQDTTVKSAGGAGAEEPTASADFEAIASAISDTLTASSRPLPPKLPGARPEGDTGLLAADSATQPARPHAQRGALATPTRPEATVEPARPARRRTTGEHVAQVIDQLVERRKQQRHSPQVVVVAPASTSGLVKAARSLVKVPAPEAPGELSVRPARRLGGRLLGAPEVGGEPQFSERVEVIQDDDSSAFLATAHNGLDGSEPATGNSLHVAREPSQPRLRSVRQEARRSELERYAPVPAPLQAQGAASQRRSAKLAHPDHEAKLYSAEQLIRDHMLKSKARMASSKLTGEGNDTSTGGSDKVPKFQLNSSGQVKLAPTTGRPELIHHQRRQQTAPTPPTQPEATGVGVQPVRVPLFEGASGHHYQPLMHMQVQPAESQQVQLQASQEPLPSFADQEINVPAHLAESVIRDIQSAPATLLNLGPNQAHQIHQTHQMHQIHQIHQPNSQPPQQLSSLKQVPSLSSSSSPQAHRQHHESLQAAAASRRPTIDPLSLHQQALYLASQQQQLQHQQRQWAAQAEALARLTAEHRAQQQEAGGVARSEPATSAGSREPRGLFQPAAQSALRHLFSSFGQQALQQQSQVDQRQSRQSSSADEQQQQHSKTNEMAAGSDLQPVQMAMAPNNQELAMEPSGYGPMYHRAPPLGYQEAEQDKKAKGVTFHFGGGPIGGGTQLITSPMGIFKHLMIPLLPNPRECNASG